MISRREERMLREREPKFEDTLLSLIATGRQPKGIIREARKIIAIARKFNDEVARPASLVIDRKGLEDHRYLPWEYVKKANDFGLYTLFVPKMFGGKGYNLSGIGMFLEELGSACLAMANLVGVHYLGYTMLTSSWNLRLMNKLSQQVVEGEASGEPCLLSLAMTEPDAGTDSQNVEMMNTGNLRCHARRVDGGYILNGTKIFISCGHLSTWHLIHAYTDLNRAAQNTVMLAVKTGSKGFSFGKKEKKMGQQACPASELIFNDCFVPDEYVCLDNQEAIKFKRSVEGTNEQIFAYIWGASRTGVGSFGTAAARGAYEEALKFASETEIDGQLLINHEWCQCMLAEMYRTVAVARASYFEATQANAMHGLWKIMNHKPMYYMNRLTPGSIMAKITAWFCEQPFATTLFRKVCFDMQTNEEIDRIDGWGSIAKITGTDAGVKNCQMALEIMGQAGLRHSNRAEKILRDAKLLQIYEGTNQVNRVNVFKRLINRSSKEVCAFSPTNI